MKNVLETTSLLADAILDGNLQSIDEQLVGIYGLAPKLFDLAHFDLAAVQIRVKQTKALAGRFDLFDGRGTCQQHDFVRYLGRGNPYFLPIDHITIPPAHRRGF
ncbi:hypothetical protein D3C76_1050160 [compost metagenome]